jgi:penicillin-insensitive murein endopeptidase
MLRGFSGYAIACGVCAACVLASSAVLADALINPWQALRTPAKGVARSIGDYSAGCLSGAETLPLDGDGYRVMRPGRRRNYGHPQLVDFIRTLGAAMHARGLAPILIGDLGQVRGGPQPNGHSSHQIGLDVDIWFWSSDEAAAPGLSRKGREAIQARSVIDGKKGALNAEWTPRMIELLHTAANDARVSRMFVHPIIKRALCEQIKDDRAWLGKLRPWYGHDDHVHVRLACPTDSPECKSQAAPPPGDGCDQLDWWFNAKAKQDRAEGLAKYHDKVASMPALPEQCAALLK